MNDYDCRTVLVPPRVAIIVLNYNTSAMSDALASYLAEVLDYPNKRLYIVDNGSSEPPSSTTHRLPDNLGFTRGMHAAWAIAAADERFDAYWLLDSDVGFSTAPTSCAGWSTCCSRVPNTRRSRRR